MGSSYGGGMGMGMMDDMSSRGQQLARNRRLIAQGKQIADRERYIKQRIIAK